MAAPFQVTVFLPPGSIKDAKTQTSPAAKTPPQEIPVRIAVKPNSVSPVCDIKREIAKLTGVAPLMQRLRQVGGVDDFGLPGALRATFRQSRNVTGSVKLVTMNMNAPTYEIKVDPEDTFLDLKFLTQEELKIAPEAQRFFVASPGPNYLSPISDSKSIAELGLQNGGAVKIQFCFPSEKPGHGEIHRTAVSLMTHQYPDVLELCSSFRKSAKRFGQKRFLGTRRFTKDGSVGGFTWQTYGQVSERVTNFASGLRQLGLKKGDALGLISPNQAEWLIADIAGTTQGFITVPLYDTLGPDAVRYIINHAQVRAVVASFAQAGKVEKLRVSGECPSLEYVILMDDNLRTAEQQQVLQYVANLESGSSKSSALSANKTSAPYVAAAAGPPPAQPNKEATEKVVLGFTHTFSRVESIGKAHHFPDNPAQPNDIFTICYTSGTTGDPKGAVITHGNILACGAAVAERLPPDLQSENETLISYLPLAHIYERTLEWNLLGRGQGIGYFQGDTLKLVDDVLELKPSIFPGVPRVWQRVYDRVTGQIAESNFLRKWLFQKAVQAKKEQHARGDCSRTWLDNLVLSKVAARFGGNLKLTISGAAPISPAVADFLKVCMLANYGEGYGLTETCAALTTISMTEKEFGHVGSPVACCEVKLVDVPDMNYLTTDRPFPRGEVWVRGPNVFVGYYRSPELSAECMEDGWFKTGDVGMWRADGNLQIIDRKKNIFKLAQGEYIRPEYIESVYKQNKYIGNIFVYGDSNQDYLVAIVVPNFETLGAWAESAGLKDIAKDQKALCKDPKVRKFIEDAMTATGVAAKLRGFEFVKRVHITTSDFTVENGLLTPTFKLKRFAVQQAYKEALDSIYRGIDSKL
jgi:long-chain acyl-CoA synthetase